MVTKLYGVGWIERKHVPLALTIIAEEGFPIELDKTTIKNPICLLQTWIPEEDIGPFDDGCANRKLCDTFWILFCKRKNEADLGFLLG